MHAAPAEKNRAVLIQSGCNFPHKVASRTQAYLSLNSESERLLISAALDAQPVNGLTHNFYRYPARFSPNLVGAAIDIFSNPGDLVLDPFMGGGTTLVEALSRGRTSVGVDISALATFVASVKTAMYDDDELERLTKWARRLESWVDLRRYSTFFGAWAQDGYYRHLDHPSRWRLRKAIEQALESAIRLGSEKQEGFARCVILRTAQWALDGRKTLPRFGEFRKQLIANAEQMIEGARTLRGAIERYKCRPTVHCLNRSAAGLDGERIFLSLPTPRLVVTSPPYPGIHVLYHRWQVDGRKETPAPFWIANQLDGSGGAHYTMGDRKANELNTYFDTLKSTLRSVLSLCDGDTTIVQILAFGKASWQLPRYLEVATDVGLSEWLLPSLTGNGDGRLWRSVPNRKWYADQRGKTDGSREVVLFHRRAA